VTTTVEAVARPTAATIARPGPMIVAEGLGRRFGDFWAIRDVNFTLGAGEVFGLLGPNGAGKTTTVRVLTALIAPSEGVASVDGFDVVTSPEEVRARIGLLTETPGLYERLTAIQNLDFFGRMHGLPADVRGPRIERLMRLFEVWDRRNDQAGTFSKGMKQKLAIARALLHEPSVLFFDEPTSGLDPEAAFIVREAIADLKGAGRTIVLCTHNLDEAERLCDRVAFMRGQILRVDSPARLRAAAGTTMVRVTLAQAATAALLTTLRAVPGVRAVDGAADELAVQVEDARRDTPLLVRALASSGADVLGVAAAPATLESVYFDVMGVRPPTNGGQTLAGIRSGD
jgi:ABC-2 type transport system ATP-binding protein